MDEGREREREKEKERGEMTRPRMRITTRDGWIGLASGFLSRDITESSVTCSTSESAGPCQ